MDYIPLLYSLRGCQRMGCPSVLYVPVGITGALNPQESHPVQDSAAHVAQHSHVPSPTLGQGVIHSINHCLLLDAYQQGAGFFLSR